MPTTSAATSAADAGVHVHDRAAGEVERAHVGEPAAAPDPVAERAVDQERPQRDEHDVGGEAHPLDDGAGDERRRDDRERALEAHEQQVRDRPLLGEPDAVQEDRECRRSSCCPAQTPASSR